MPLRYMQLLWAKVLDWLLFGVHLSLRTFLGGRLILLSG